MNNKIVYQIGDEVQAEDGRVGVVISIDKDLVHQGSTMSQLIVVKFRDQLTTIGNAEEFKAVHERSFSKADS